MGFIDSTLAFFERNKIFFYVLLGVFIVVFVAVIIILSYKANHPDVQPGPEPSVDYFGTALDVFWRSRTFTAQSKSDSRYYPLVADIQLGSDGVTYQVGQTYPTTYYTMYIYGSPQSFATRAEAATVITTPYNAQTSAKVYSVHQSAVLSDFASFQPVAIPQ